MVEVAAEETVVVVVEVVEVGVEVGGKVEAEAEEEAEAGATDRRVDGLDLAGGSRDEGSLSTAGLGRGFADGLLDAMDYAMRQPGLVVFQYLALAPQSALICPTVRGREANKTGRMDAERGAVARPSLSVGCGTVHCVVLWALCAGRWAIDDGRAPGCRWGRESLESEQVGLRLSCSPVVSMHPPCPAQPKPSQRPSAGTGLNRPRRGGRATTRCTTAMYQPARCPSRGVHGPPRIYMVSSSHQLAHEIVEACAAARPT